MAENETKKGISVDSEHIFPIIKRWLYSEKEIFLREIVSNASDAVTKLKRLMSLGEVTDIDDKFRIDVILNKTAGTVTVSDNGIGMTADELEKYLCNMALSGAVDFIQKYEGEDASSADGIIGHFGLGFYSSFMVSDTVTVISRSYQGGRAVKWVCDSDGDYEIFPDDRKTRGTEIIMEINDEEKEYLNESKLRDILDKYCSFMPVEIYFSVEGEEKKDGKEKPINDTTPLWQKQPSECTDEEYKEFYTKVFKDYKEPLFQIHINADYPLNFKGILYFPRLNSEFDNLEGQVKLYYNQVFVADNIKEVIPEFMLMLKGVLDCPELPLNVSRSYLQNSGYVSKISAHIVKKVADKLTSMFKQEREKFEEIWNNLKIFVEYGCIRDSKFYDRVKSCVLLADAAEDKFYTVDEYLETAKEKHENTIYYCNDKVAQAQYISMFADKGIKVVVFDKMLDTSFMQTVEQKREGVKFVRIDADTDVLKAEGEIKESEKTAELFKKVSGNDSLTVKFDRFSDEKVPALINISEEERRFNDMMRIYNTGSMPDMPLSVTLVINSASPLAQKLIDEAEADSEKAEKLAKQIYTLSLMAQRKLSADQLKEFLNDSFDILLNM